MKKNVFPREIWLADLKENKNANGVLLKDTHPVLILNDYKTLGKQDLIQVAPVTSNTERLLRSHLELNGYGLDKDSKVLFEQVTTLHRDQIIMKLGKVEDVETNKAIDAMIKKVILVDSESQLNLDNVISTFNMQLQEKAELEKLNNIMKDIRDNYFSKDYKNVEELCNKLVEATKKTNIPRARKNNFLFNAYYMIAMSNYNVKNINESIENIEKSLKYINDVDDKHNYANAMWCLGNCFAEVDREFEASKVFEQLSKYYKNNNLQKERYVCVFNIAFCNRNFNKMNKIINMIENHKDNVWYGEADKMYVLEDLKSEVKRLGDKLNIR
ncbi:type II toxin-antitoxin system PemK/MazF family toxin [Clostridium sp. C8-1-8]|uniref:type II toxin-antitoxin system PemK/MazF family toxin n=1 Tax=Clostridium sp. C8-1-8 TaxID=2698831 RepID=UPI00136869A8|nr:type II toxin-antitoxin system PemK/MazF family toxin [Clostridium sp. C8-1-8]